MIFLEFGQIKRDYSFNRCCKNANIKLLYYFNKSKRTLEEEKKSLMGIDDKYKDDYYVTAYCELRNDIRHFEIKRIINVK